MLHSPTTAITDLSPGFSVIHSNRVEDLRRVAVEWIRKHPPAPLETETFIVQSNGMAQWLKLALAGDDGCGISAAAEFILPARFLWRAYRTVIGPEAVPPQSPYDKDKLTWRLMRLLPGLAVDARFTFLTRFLADDPDLRKHYQLAYRLADLYDQYQVYRADWLQDWAAGRDRLQLTGGQSTAIPVHQAWQPVLWRRIREDVPSKWRATSRSELHAIFGKQVLAAIADPSRLPIRVIVFGISSLPRQTLQVLQAISRHSQVLLFVHNPCRHFWTDIVADRQRAVIQPSQNPTRTGSTSLGPAGGTIRHQRKQGMPDHIDGDAWYRHINPLLAAWGKQGGDYIGMLYGYDQPDRYQALFDGNIDLFDDFRPQGRPGTLLQQVQQAILDLKPIPADSDSKPEVLLQDRSIRFNTAHGRQREIEILQDQLLDMFDHRPDLNPAEIIVMAPDIEAYAPHIEAVFGNVAANRAAYIPYTIADRFDGRRLALLQGIEKLLHLPESRLTVGDVTDLLQLPAFRERFAVSENELPQLSAWIEGAGIRWGVDAVQRESFGLPSGLDQNSWQFGLDRMLLGYAVGGGAPWRGIEPYDEIGGLEAAHVGALATILARLEKYGRLLSRPAAADTWSKRLRGMLEECLKPAGRSDQLMLKRIQEEIEAWRQACEEAQLTDVLTLNVVREALLSALRRAGMSQRFLAGRVNFGTLMPMRAIPFKVVCLIGMNDGEFPRSQAPMDFDLMAASRNYRPGDRSRREDDRYLFLEALLSARENLYISYIGHSARDNSPRTPSVLVSQLGDYLSAGWGLEDNTAKNDLVRYLTGRHPLQPFGRAYFRDPGDGTNENGNMGPELFTYAAQWRAALDRDADQNDNWPLPPPEVETGPTLHDLIQLLKEPAKLFFTRRLKVYFEDAETTLDPHEPFDLDPLAPFGPGQQLLASGLASPEGDRQQVLEGALAQLRRSGALPMAGFGELAAESLAQPVAEMLGRHDRLTQEWPHPCEPFEIDLPLMVAGGPCERLQDWLEGMYQQKPAGGAYARWEFYPLPVMDRKGSVSRLSSMIGLWVRHLAACAAGLNLTSFLVAPDGTVCLKPLGQAAARSDLEVLGEHWWQGLRQPLPVTGKTALAYWRVLLNPPVEDAATLYPKALEAARRAYEGDGYNSAGELGYSLYLQRVYPRFSDLLKPVEPSFDTLAGRLYRPLAKAVWGGSA